MPSIWKTVRVFISSTFRDMHAERDYLVKVVFPKLRQWCDARRIHLVDIDLRWGVTEADERDGGVLDICFKEVDGCRPFFVCILGARYGSVPNPLPAEGALPAETTESTMPLWHVFAIWARQTDLPHFDSAFWQVDDLADQWQLVRESHDHQIASGRGACAGDG